MAVGPQMQIGIILVALAFPLLELAVLIKVGQTIGLWWTLLLLAAMGVGGGMLVHQQGVAAARRTFEQMAEGEAPLAPMLDSVLIMLAGVLLLIPGLITDVAGLLLLVPPVRRGVARWGLRRAVASGGVHVETRQWRSPGRANEGSTDHSGAEGPSSAGASSAGPGIGRPRGPAVIEGEWQRVDDPKAGDQPGSKRGKQPDGDR